MEPFRLFLAHSFAREKLNHLAAVDPQGISDFELAEMVERWIVKRSAGRIVVVRTRDPFHDYISSSVRRDISSSDGMLCLFTKRTRDQLTGLWIASTYVMTEGSAAQMQFPSEVATHGRLFGLVEEGVDASQLGMAFHGNMTAPRFRRDDLPQLESHVGRIVDAILDLRPSDRLREDREYLSIEKVVSIWKSGAVWVETRHRYRFTTEMETVRIPHTIWRVRDSLPNVGELLGGTRDSGAGFLRLMPLHCGKHDQNKCKCQIKPGNPTHWGFERNFFVEFNDVRIQPGEELAYEIVWGYPNAFRNPGIVKDERPNSVGLRTSGRGAAANASLTLKFERDWEFEPLRTLERPPQFFTTDITDLPGAQSPEEFWHESPTWKPSGELRPCGKRSCTFFEVYRWSTDRFHGMARATWIPHMNYFIPGDTVNRTAQTEAAAAGERVGRLGTADL